MDAYSTYTLDKNGLTLPIEVLRHYGLAEGDEVVIIEAEQGLVVLPREAAALAALKEIGRSLKAKGIKLDELMERGTRSEATF